MTITPRAPSGVGLIAREDERAGRRAIEQADFPFERLSELGRLESWRKEIHRPIYHLHKWWAQRLGSIVRGAIIGAAAPEGADVARLLPQPVRLDGWVVLDPFMGSGTTCGEAHKLGARPIGFDINPVAVRAARVALGPLDRARLDKSFERVRAEVEGPLRALHATTDDEGRPAEALYWFWVKTLPCPACQSSVDLFSSRIFARHAYAERSPTVRASCPGCGAVLATDHRATRTDCEACRRSFDPRLGPVARGSATCPACGYRFALVAAARALGRPPPHRLYAKLVLTKDGDKRYLAPTERDRAAYQAAEAQLLAEDLVLPTLGIEDGHNTRQILAYNYRRWRDAFNARQLLGLGWLAAAIRRLEPSPEREALGVLFSGTLEFNNLFATYKGEGTGAVRHMFSHHILKPERTPIEANLWGTPKSSGAFSTLYKTRLVRALDYRERPFEVLPDRFMPARSVKVHGLSPPVDAKILDRYPDEGLSPRAMVLGVRDAKETGLPNRSVDLVVTDPPYFDNVHYSELADFFEAWVEAWSGSPSKSTRRAGEVQDVDPERFSNKLQGILAECARVLVDDGLVVFSYHHAREAGWEAVGRALLGAGLSPVEAHPVKAELSRAAPKIRSKAPIDIDVLLVARKAAFDRRARLSAEEALAVAEARAAERAARHRSRVGPLSLGDARVLLSSQLLVSLSPGRGKDDLSEGLAWAAPYLRDRAAALSEGKE